MVAIKRARLNPNAQVFLPSSYLAVEDFSPEWWDMIRNDPSFREFWLRDRYDCEDDVELTGNDVEELEACEEFAWQQAWLGELERCEEMYRESNDSRIVEGRALSELMLSMEQKTAKHSPRSPQLMQGPPKHRLSPMPRTGAAFRIQQPR